MTEIDDNTPASRSYLTLRHELHASFGPAQGGVSADGATVYLMGPVESGLLVGGFAVLEGEDGDGWASLVVQVRTMSLVEREGPHLELSTEFADADLTVKSASARPLLRAPRGSGAVLGVIETDRFVRHQQVAPFGERLVRPARRDSSRKGSPATRSCAGSRARARRTRPARCSNGCWRRPPRRS